MIAVAGTLREGVKKREAQKNLQNFSKLAKENTNYRLFFPTVGDTLETCDIIIAAGLGRKLDKDALEKSFVGYDKDDFSISESSGRFIDTTQVAKLVPMARALHAAECELMKKKREKEIAEEASLMKQKVNPVTVAEALRRIDIEYFGDDTVVPKTFAKKNPVIGSLDVTFVTEVYAVPLTVDGLPDFKNAFHAGMELSNKKSQQLQTILQKKEYCRPELGYLEVGYDYIGQNKRLAGQNASFNGIAETLALSNNPQTSAMWEANKDKLNVLSRDNEVMLAKNATFAYACTPSAVIACFNKYVSTKTLTFAYLDFESDLVKNNAESFLELDTVKELPSVQQKLLAVIEASEAEKEVQADDVSEEAMQASTATKLTELEGVDIDSMSTLDVDDL